MIPSMAFALLAAHPAVTAGQGGLIGVWEVVELEKDGQKVAKEHTPVGKLCLTGKEYLCADRVLLIGGSYRLDTSKQPHLVTFTAYNGDGKGREETMAYELTGDTLRLTFRPSGWEPQTIVWKRVRP